MAFWSSLTFTGTRVAGQRERQTQSYEAGTTYFPRDYPFTSAYEEFSKEKEAELKASWDRKPPAKRTNFEKLVVHDPFSPNWNQIIGVRPQKGQQDLVSTQRGPRSESTCDAEPWLLRGASVASVVERLASSAAAGDSLVEEINKLRGTRSLGPLNISGPNLLRGALVIVKVNVCGRGLPQDLALIYALDNREVTRAITSFKRKEPQGEDGGNEVSRKSTRTSDMQGSDIPTIKYKDLSEKNALIGRVTTGNYSLTIGKGYAVGAVSLARWLELLAQQPDIQQTTSDHTIAPFVKIRNTNTNQFRLARLELLVEGDA